MTKENGGGRTCPACDMELDGSVGFTNGLCPYCARENELAADEEVADALKDGKVVEVRHED